MDQEQLFTLALGLTSPWQVESIEFSLEEKRLDLHLGFPRGSRFACPKCGQACAIHDTREREWRHMDFFQHAAYLHARVPRVKCPEHGVQTVAVPWAREGSGFTLLFEALLMTLVRAMPVQAVARQVREHDTRIWRVLHHDVSEARSKVAMAKVRKIGVDETSNRRGHDFITLFVDLEEKRLLFATTGKDAATVQAFAEDLAAHGGDAQKIEEVSMDFSSAFQKGVRASLPKAQVTFDRFHLMKLVNEAVDAVRRAEVHAQPNLKKTRWLWLKNAANLNEQQQKQLEELRARNSKTARAYQMRLSLQEVFTVKERNEAVSWLKTWVEDAKNSELPPMVKVAYTVENHWEGIVRWFESNISNGILEGFNSLLQSAKAKARGYRNPENFINMAYLVLGRLNLNLQVGDAHQA